MISFVILFILSFNEFSDSTFAFFNWTFSFLASSTLSIKSVIFDINVWFSFLNWEYFSIFLLSFSNWTFCSSSNFLNFSISLFKFVFSFVKLSFSVCNTFSFVSTSSSLIFCVSCSSIFSKVNPVLLSFFAIGVFSFSWLCTLLLSFSFGSAFSLDSLSIKGFCCMFIDSICACSSFFSFSIDIIWYL